MEQDVSESFEKLRPTCVAVAKAPTKEAIDSLFLIVKSIPTDHMQTLQEYVLFPLRMVLKRYSTGADELFLRAANAMTSVVEKSHLKSFDILADLTSIFFIFLNPPDAKANVVHSEECYEAVILCLAMLLQRADEGVLLKFYSSSRLPVIGHGVSTLLKLSEGAPSRHLRLASIECLAVLSQGCRAPKTAIYQRASACFASFLPGIALSLSKIITGDEKSGQQIIARSIDVWKDVVTLVMADSGVENRPLQAGSDDQDGVTSGQEADGPDGDSKGLEVRRTSEWLRHTASKLRTLLDVIGERSVKHPSFRVRLAVARLASSCLSLCARSMEQCTQTLLEILMGLINDEHTVVADCCQQALQDFGLAAAAATPPAQFELQLPVTPGRRLSLQEILEENIYGYAMRLPRLLQQPDDEARISSLRLLHGYLKVLGMRMQSLLNSCAHLRRLSQAFMQVLEMDCSSLRLLHEGVTNVSLTAGTRLSLTSDDSSCPDQSTDYEQRQHQHDKLWRQFKHFNDDRVWKELACCLHLLGTFGDLNVLVDHFLDAMNESSLHEKEAALILNEILRGRALSFDNASHEGEGCRRDADTGDLMDMLMREYLGKIAGVAEALKAGQSEGRCGGTTPLDMVAVGSGRSAVSSAITRANSSVLFTCVLLEGIAVIFEVAGPGCVHLLMDSLYVILDQLSDDTLIISQTACLTLVRISSTLNYRDVSQLLCCHADYIVNSLALRLRRIDRYPRAPLVLRAVFQYGDQHILPLVEDVVVDILHTLDCSHEEQAAAVTLSALRTLLNSILLWFPFVKEKQMSPVAPLSLLQDLAGSYEKGSNVSGDRVRDFFLDYYRQKQKSTMEDSTPEEACGSTEATLDAEAEQWAADAATDDQQQDVTGGVDEPTPPPPLHVQLASKVLDRCCHLLSHDSPRIRISALEAAVRSCQVLQHVQDELLPAVHKIWSPLVCRLADEEPAVVLSAFECLHVLAELSKDFIRQRLSKDVLPKLCAYLRTQSLVSTKTGPAYKHTTSYRLQRALLKCIGSIVSDVAISEKDLDSVCNACLPYLSSRQPSPLQEDCVHCVQCLAAIDADTIWLRLNLLHCPQLPPPPHPCFREIKFTAHGSTAHAPEYAENVSRLLRDLG